MTLYASKLLLITLLYVTHSCQTMIMRNNALMSKMMSHISSQKDSNQQEPQHDIQRPERVLSLMQNVLCRNFPLIPCKMIVEDNALRKLIEKSIQQIKYKKLSLEKTTSRPDHLLTLFPTVNSEDLSNFLQKHERGYYGTNQKDFQTHKKKQKKSVPPTVFWLHENPGKTNKKNKKQTKRAYEYTGRKKIRKFYPHKIKYKDKIEKNARSPGDYSDEKLSMSVEVPDMTLTKRHQHLSYKVEPVEPAVWRIDYTKHGEPSVNMLGYDTDQLKGKIMKTGPNVIFDDNVLDPAARKDVLHPDVYIKNNFVRKNLYNVASDGMD